MDDLKKLIEIVKYQHPDDVETRENVLRFIEVLNESKMCILTFKEYHVKFSDKCRIKEIIISRTLEGYRWGYSTNEIPKNRASNGVAKTFLKMIGNLQLSINCVYDPHYGLHLAC